MVKSRGNGGAIADTMNGTVGWDEQQLNRFTASSLRKPLPQKSSLVVPPLLEASRRGRSLDWRLGRLETDWQESQSDCGTVEWKRVSQYRAPLQSQNSQKKLSRAGLCLSCSKPFLSTKVGVNFNWNSWNNSWIYSWSWSFVRNWKFKNRANMELEFNCNRQLGIPRPDPCARKHSILTGWERQYPTYMQDWWAKSKKSPHLH